MEEEEAIKRISRLLEMGGTMLANHHDCGAPLFRYKGEVVCPVCSFEEVGAAQVLPQEKNFAAESEARPPSISESETRPLSMSESETRALGESRLIPEAEKERGSAREFEVEKVLKLHHQHITGNTVKLSIAKLYQERWDREIRWIWRKKS